ncbi:MAG TPA: hypothetical protein VFB70_00495 [Pyrinomonadaceae bacterium]|nr:hypothetical protein [Pyrinomonadaceae bacterium]
MVSSSFLRVLLALVVISQLGVLTVAQECDREQAFSLIQEQIAQAKTLEKTAARISVLTQGADLLWPYRQSAARSAFEEAFEVASQGNTPDQRFVVIRAIAQRDSEWARRLAKAIAEEKRSDEEAGVSTDNRYRAETLLNVAGSLLQNDSKTAISFARASLRYPASVALARFLFQLWSVDKQAASRFYQQALSVYANAPVNQLLYLSAYPFGINRVVGPEMQSTFFVLPKEFTPDTAAESAFLEVILRRGQETKARPTQPVSGPVAQPEIVQIYLALNSLQASVARDQPAYAGRVISLVTTLEPLLSAEARHEASNIARWHQDLNLSLETIAERIENEKVPEKKDRLIARAVLASKSTEELERVESLVDKVSESKFRGELLDWLYFKRTQKLVSDGRLDEAAQLIPKLSEVDHRAYLAFLLATESTKKIKDSALVLQVLEDVVKTALKAPNTNEKARTLLGLTSSYAKFDRTRAFEILGEAINVINKIDEPDLTSTAVLRRIGTDRFTIHVAYEMRTSSLDTVFREFAIDDFVKSLWLANQLPDKPLRATGTFAISGRCLEISKEPSQ